MTGAMSVQAKRNLLKNRAGGFAISNPYKYLHDQYLTEGFILTTACAAILNRNLSLMELF